MWDKKPSSVLSQARAAYVWQLYGFQSPEDLVLEDLALALGVLVLEGPLDTAEARLVRKGNRGLIRVKQDIPEPGRKRFAIAHEIGHWLLHENLTQILACTSQDMVAKYKASAPEIEANYFAAELLMPEKLFKPMASRGRPSAELIKRVAAEFGTTLTSTAIRFAEVMDDYFAVVFSEKGRIRWSRGSKPFEKRYWLEPGTTLSLDTVAGRYFRDGVIHEGSHELDRGAWLQNDVDDSDEPIFEEIIPLTRYGQVMSLIWFK